jgi:hypothetical protein
MGAAKNHKKTIRHLWRHILQWNVSASYSPRAGHTDYFTLSFLSPFVHASIHEFSRHHLPPFSDTTLERPQLTVSKTPWVLTLEVFKQFLCGYLWTLLQPMKDLMSDCLKGIFSGPPMSRFRGLGPMSWSYLSRLP